MSLLKHRLDVFHASLNINEITINEKVIAKYYIEDSFYINGGMEELYLHQEDIDLLKQMIDGIDDYNMKNDLIDIYDNSILFKDNYFCNTGLLEDLGIINYNILHKQQIVKELFNLDNDSIFQINNN